MKNKLIVFEGIDGVGKTTLSKLLQDRLVKQGVKTVRYEDIEEKNSGFNQLKPFIKTQAPINSSLLFYISSAIYKSQQIEKLLKHNWVICDRYIYSTLAYHKIRNADMSLIPDVKKIPLRLPDFLFLLKVNDNIRLKRIKARSNNTDDLKIKTSKNLVGKMEKELEKFKPIIIDNSYLTSVDVIENIYAIVNILSNKTL
jgi:dTMP kinase